jgi:hypothetical protein
MLETTYKGTTRRMEFMVVSENVETLVGLPTLRELGLIYQVDRVTAVPNVVKKLVHKRF